MKLPLLKIVTYEVDGKNVHVVRDDILEAGTKERGHKYFEDIKLRGFKGVIASAAITGYGQVAISKMAKMYGLSCYIVVASSLFKTTGLVKKSLSLGANYVKVSRKNDKLHFIDPITNKRQSIDTGYPNESRVTYVSSGLLNLVSNHISSNHPEIISMGLGLEDPNYIRYLARAIKDDGGKHEYPKRLWIACGSGTLVRAMAMIWPLTEFMCVQVGRDIEKNLENIQLHQIRIAPYKFAEEVTDPDLLPPYSSLPNYDAKVWQFVLDECEEGDFVWNVAGNIE